MIESVSEWFAQEPITFDSIEDFLQASKEAYGFAPVLQKCNQQYLCRFYTDAENGTQVYEGNKRFDKNLWFHNGANWEVIAKDKD